MNPKRPIPKDRKFIQTNLHQSRLQRHFFVKNLLEEKFDTVLIQKPWVYGEKMRGLCSRRETKFSAGLSFTPSSCIFVRNTTDAFLLSEPCSRDVMTVRITYTK